MLKQLHLTRRQWLGILKWTLYALFFLFVMIVQTVILARLPIFGIKLTLVPLVLVCVCIREGPERGGVFALLASTVWCLSGADYGNLSIVLLTFCAVLSSVLCIAVLLRSFWTGAVCCLLTMVIHEGGILLFKVLLGRIAPSNLWRVVLPGVALSMLAYPLIYLIVKLIGKSGGDHGV